MKKLLFLLFAFVTVTMQAQTANGTETQFEAIQVTSPQIMPTSANVPSIGADGTMGKVAGENITTTYVPVNYSPANSTLKAQIGAIDVRLGQIGNTTAGITSRIFFTGDNVTVTAGTFFASNGSGKGTATSGLPTPLVNGDNQKQYFVKDLISIAQPSATTAPPGNYSGQLTVSSTPTPNGTFQRYTIEIYKTNNGGTPIASGITGAPTGNLGVTVVAILDSGQLNLVAGAITNISLNGNLASTLYLATGERLRYHVSAQKIGTGGGNVTMSVLYGSDYNSYYDVTVTQKASTVINDSGISGGNVADALINLNSGKESVYNVSEFLQKNTNIINLTPLGVDSAAGNAVDPSGNVTSIPGSYKYKTFANVVQPNTTYTLDGLYATQGNRISFRNASNTVIGVYSTPTEVSSPDGKTFQIHESTPITFTTPANCVTILVNTVGADGVDPTSIMTLTKGYYTFDYYKKFSNWVGKKIHWLGDSMTENNVMQPKVAKDLKTVNFIDGIGGALITPNFENIVGDGTRRPSFAERAKNNALFPSDMMVVYGGYNDFGYGAPIGSISDIIAPTFNGTGQINPSSVVGATFYGALNYIVKYYATTYPDKPIRLITQTYNGAVSPSTYATQEAYVNAMINVGVKNNIPVLDLFHGSGINSDNVMTYTLDGVHYNDIGATLVSQKVIPFLNNGIGNTVFPLPLVNPVTGTGAIGYVGFWQSPSVLNGTGVFTWDNINKRLGVGIGLPIYTGDFRSTSGYQARFSTADTYGNAAVLFAAKGSADPNYYGEITYTNSTNIFAFNSQSGSVSIGTSTTGNAPSEKVNIGTTGIVKINNLSGTGIRTIVADAGGNLSAISNGITGTGVNNYIPVFTASGIIGQGSLFQTGSRVSLGTNISNSRFTALSGVVSDSPAISNTGAFLGGGDGGIAFGQYTSSLNSDVWYQSMLTNGTVKNLIINPLGGNIYIGSNTAGNQIATKSDVQPYKIYTALIDQSSTSNPTTTILGNNTIGAIVWTRSTNGFYFGTLTGAFPAGKTYLSITPSSPTASYSIFRNTSDQIVIRTQDNSTVPFTDADTKLFSNSIKIEVYP